MQDFSDRRIEEVLTWSQRDQEEFFYEAFNSLSHRDQKRYMNALDEDLNIFSEKNKRKAAKAAAKKRMRKYNRTRSRRNSS